MKQKILYGEDLDNLFKRMNNMAESYTLIDARWRAPDVGGAKPVYFFSILYINKS